MIDNYGQSFNKYIKSLTPISNQRKTKETQKPVKNDVLEMRIKRNEIKSNEMNVWTNDVREKMNEWVNISMHERINEMP